MIYKDKKRLIEELITPSDVVLDVGFAGQGVRAENPLWPHRLLQDRAKEVYGVDLELDDLYLSDHHYQKANAENFEFKVKFDVIFAGDIIEHLSNPGLFLETCKKHLSPSGRLIITTPNTFNLFNLAEKITKREPTVNPDHTFYFNSKTLSVLINKNGMQIISIAYLYQLDIDFKESLKKKFLNLVYRFLSNFTDKFIETLVIVATVP